MTGASGPSGSNADYVVRLCRSLRALRLRCDHTFAVERAAAYDRIVGMLALVKIRHQRNTVANASANLPDRDQIFSGIRSSNPDFKRTKAALGKQCFCFVAQTLRVFDLIEPHDRSTVLDLQQAEIGGGPGEADGDLAPVGDEQAGRQHAATVGIRARWHRVVPSELRAEAG